eukprot:Protomagalhaensia_sp_Gyna_25__5889@NODE_891_length_2454_cov_16_514700_g704_i0_p1_GENE_NODE_891_length_2454_cov_16_514700_g704_i0NODE_891_length_2454_cov_16_514700_g704_i0_p1_ORF_typecomplete_len379_score27_95_NODE_891_length_2454_cov_16_514700_g704_i012392375
MSSQWVASILTLAFDKETRAGRERKRTALQTFDPELRDHPFFASIVSEDGTRKTYMSPLASTYYELMVLIDTQREAGRFTETPSQAEMAMFMHSLYNLFLTYPYNEVLQRLFYKTSDGVVCPLRGTQKFLEAVATLESLRGAPSRNWRPRRAAPRRFNAGRQSSKNKPRQLCKPCHPHQMNDRFTVEQVMGLDLDPAHVQVTLFLESDADNQAHERLTNTALINEVNSCGQTFRSPYRVVSTQGCPDSLTLSEIEYGPLNDQPVQLIPKQASSPSHRRTHSPSQEGGCKDRVLAKKVASTIPISDRFYLSLTKHARYGCHGTPRYTPGCLRSEKRSMWRNPPEESPAFGAVDRIVRRVRSDENIYQFCVGGQNKARAV